jgi:ATP-dependent Clp protease ATP-binding subunit ClpA
MRLTLSPAVDRALLSATRIARGSGKQEVDPTSMLIALLREPDGQAAILAESSGVNLSAFRDQEEVAGETLPLSDEMESAVTRRPRHCRRTEFRANCRWGSDFSRFGAASRITKMAA